MLKHKIKLKWYKKENKDQWTSLSPVVPALKTTPTHKPLGQPISLYLCVYPCKVIVFIVTEFIFSQTTSYIVTTLLFHYFLELTI